MSAPALRLLADDLTGALDSAAEFTALVGPVRVVSDGAAPAGSAALSSGTREATRDVAVARVRALAPALAGAGIAFKKLDSLMRGNTAAEIAACFALGAWRHCIVAPAFPAQGRVTRGGRVLARGADGGWTVPPGGDVIAALAAEGVPVAIGRCDAPLAPGVAVFDAGSDAELAQIVSLGRAAAAPVLWCGSGGLAHALAAEALVRPSAELARPVLGLFGSDQEVTTRQLAACGGCWMRIADGGEAASRVARALDDDGVALVSLALEEVPRAEAARRIATAFGALLKRVPRPGTLLVAGGETLRAVCAALGTAGLDATGLVAPGVPRSAMRGGAWDRLEVVSKSGAFGGDLLWRDLLAANGFIEGKDA